MPKHHTLPQHQLGKLWLIVAAGLALRLMLALANLVHPSADLAYVEGDNYMGAAELMLRTHDTTDPVFVPGYTMLVALFQVALGGYARAGLLLLECLLGAACIPLMFSTARRIGGERVALLCAALVAVDPLLLPRSSVLMTESVYIPLLVGSLWCYVKGMFLSGQPARQWRLIAGAALLAGCATNVRSVGLVLPMAMVLGLVCSRAVPAARKLVLCGSVALLAFLVVLPLCLHNKRKYDHFAISSSLRFNYAALVVGPTKKAFDHDTDPKLLSMWKEDIGENYESLPPFAMADTAAKAANRWALAHPGLTARDVVKGQLSMVLTPDRSSWAPGLSILHLRPMVFHAFAVAVALYRTLLCLLALYALVRWRTLLRQGWLPIFLVFTIVAHTAGVGSMGEGRVIAPVSVLIDLLSALGFFGLIKSGGWASSRQATGD